MEAGVQDGRGEGVATNSVRSPPPCGEGLGVGSFAGALSLQRTSPPPPPLTALASTLPTRGRVTPRSRLEPKPPLLPPPAPEAARDGGAGGGRGGGRRTSRACRSRMLPRRFRVRSSYGKSSACWPGFRKPQSLLPSPDAAGPVRWSRARSVQAPQARRRKHSACGNLSAKSSRRRSGAETHSPHSQSPCEFRRLLRGI